VSVHAAPWLVPIAGAPIADGAVALADDGRVLAVGTRAQLIHFGTVVEHGGVLMPGVINAHLHLELSHLRVPGGDGLVPWIRRLLAERARPAANDGAGAAAAAAARAMAGRGTVAAVDHANEGATAPLLAAAGVRPRMLVERLGRGAPLALPDGTPLIHNGAAALQNGTAGIAAIEETAHATYSCAPELVRQIAAASDGKLASIHVEEDPAEISWLRDGDGPFADFLRERDALPAGGPPRARPVAWLDRLGVLGAGTLLVHLAVADEESLAIAARRGCIAVVCPRSNLHIGDRLPPVAAMRAAGVRVALGTDSLASAPTLDVFGDVQVLARAGVEPAWLLGAATEGGAAAFGAPELGVLAPGKRPGLIEVGDDAAGLTDPEAFVAHEAADAPIRRIA
jgi:cytosine/adenosine deaminase-related metal-dependent hydrolase